MSKSVFAKMGIQEITVKGAAKGCRVHVYTNGLDRPCATLWRSDRVKNPDRLYFGTEASRKAYVQKWIANQRQREQAKIEAREAAKNATHNVEVGCSYAYLEKPEVLPGNVKVYKKHHWTAYH